MLIRCFRSIQLFKVYLLSAYCVNISAKQTFKKSLPSQSLHSVSGRIKANKYVCFTVYEMVLHDAGEK